MSGNLNDKLGYSSAKKFANILINKSLENKNFIIDYKNDNKDILGNIVNLFIKFFKKNVKYKFKNKLRPIIKKKIKSIYSNENSISILKKYYKKYKYEKSL